MSLSDTQFAELKKRLETRKSTFGDAEYEGFLQRAASSSQPAEPEESVGSNFYGDFQKGAAKGLIGKTIHGLGTLGRKAQQLLPPSMQGLPGGNTPAQNPQGMFDKGSALNKKAEEFLRPKTVSEKAGGFVGEVASYAFGGAASTLPKGANFLKRALSLGAVDGTVTTVRQGDVDKDSVDTAIIAAAFPVVGSSVNALKATMPTTADAGGRVINSLIKPLLKDFSYGKNPGKTVAKEGITAGNLDELAQKIGAKANDVGAQIGEAVKSVTDRFQLPDALKALEDAQAEAAKNPRTNAAIIGRLQNLMDDLRKVTTDADGNWTCSEKMESSQ